MLGCIDPYTHDLDDTKRYLAVSGKLNNRHPACRVKLTITQSYNDNTAFEPLNEAIVKLLEGEGHEVLLKNDSNGIYTISDPSFRATPGTTYQLYIKDPKGNEYYSEKQKMPTPPKLRNITGELVTKKIETTNINDQDIIEEIDGFEIIATIPQQPGNTSYYRFDWQSFLQLFYVHDDRSFYCITQNELKNNISVASLQELTSNELTNYTILFQEEVKSGALTIDNLDNGKEHYYNNVGWVYWIDIYNISEPVYQYWEKAYNTINYEGDIFDPIPERFTGNLYNTHENGPDIFGVFEVASVTSYPVYFRMTVSGNELYKYKLPKKDTVEVNKCKQYFKPPDYWIDEFGELQDKKN